MERSTRKTRLNQKHSTEQMFIAMASEKTPKTNQLQKTLITDYRTILVTLCSGTLSASIITTHFNEIF